MWLIYLLLPLLTLISTQLKRITKLGNQIEQLKQPVTAKQTPHAAAPSGEALPFSLP